MNIVYRLIFEKRIKENDPPYFYIGSATNCHIKNNVIYNKHNKPYYGSSSIENWKDFSHTSIAEILYSTDDPTINILVKESELQREYDVVSSSEYFNKAIAVDSYYNMPEYGMYRHNVNGAKKKLHKNDPLVLDKTYIGIWTGLTFTKSHRDKISKATSGENNPFFGKSHTEETKNKISHANTGNKWSDDAKNKSSISRKGIPKTEEHKAKIGRKGLIVLINIHTKEYVRIPRDDRINYDENIWINPYKFKSMNKTITFKHSEETKCKIGRKGYIMLKNINTGENVRVLKEDKFKYDSDIWMNPATVKRLLKEIQ